MRLTIHVDSNRTWGGGQEQSLGLARELAARGQRTYFIAQPGSALAARLAAGELEWEPVSMRGLRGLAASRRLRGIFRRTKPDLIHVHDSAAQLPTAWAAGMFGGGRRIRRRPRLVITRRTLLPLRRPWRALTYQSPCDRVICVSEAVRRRLLEARVPQELLVVIPDFVDCRRFDPAAVHGEDPGDRPVIAAVGRLTKEKGHSVLLAAMALVARAVPDARLVICGQGSEEETLRRQAETEGVAGVVEFAGFAADVRPHLASAAVIAMPSLSEGLGVAALEAMAMAKPVVASDVGGLPESVAHGETGVVVPAGDARALAEALIALLQDPERARRMGEAGRARALAVYDKPRVVDRILALYDEVLAGG